MKRKIQNEIDRQMIILFINRLDINKTFVIEISEKKARRTISQNSLYWMWLSCIEHETGTERNDLHEFFKEKYLTPEPYEIFGETKYRKSTRNLNTVQYKYLLDNIQVFASTELQITLPNPEDHNWEEFYKYYCDKL